MTPRISVIIPAYNNALEVIHCLDSLHAEAVTESVEYLVQDDCSTAPMYFPASLCKPERNEVNLGFAGNCHAGAARAKGDILLFVNQDAYCEQLGWDSFLSSEFNSHPEADIIGVKILTLDGRIQHAGIEFDEALQPTHRFAGYSDPDYPPANQTESVRAVTGAVFAIRAEAWHRHGGFDYNAFPGGYFEDVDLCLRVHYGSGGGVLYCPNIVFRHRGGTSGGGSRLTANALRFKSRWVDSRKLTPDIPAVKEAFWA